MDWNFERYVLKKLDSRTVDTSLFSALDSVLFQSNYSLKSKHLATEVGLSNRQLNRLLNKQIGMPSKKFLQTYRFAKVLDHMHRANAISLTQLAYRFGYFDQAHFIREFKSSTDITPNSYLKKIGKLDMVLDLESFANYGYVLEHE